MDRGQVDAFLEQVTKLKSWLAGREMAGTRRLRELREQGQSPDPESSLRNKGGRGERSAQNAADREESAGAVPGFESALNNGEVSPEHLDALTMARKMLAHEPPLLPKFVAHEPELLAHAARESVESFRRRCRRLAKQIIAEADNAHPDKELERQRARSNVRSWRDNDTGMHEFRISLDPVRGSRVDRKIHAELMRLRSEQQDEGGTHTPHSQLLAEAFVTAVTRTGDEGPMLPEIVVHVGLEGLAGDLESIDVLCETEDGVPMPIETVRRLACEAKILPAVMDSNGMVRDMGRGSRTATPDQKRQLATMYASCGGDENCHVPFHKCRIHHVRFWTRDRGPTDLVNLIPLCDTHHHRAHEGGWILLMDHNRVITWIMPNGVVHWEGQSMNRQPPSEQDDAA
jgi:cell division septum initiation protein DivIVA